MSNTPTATAAGQFQAPRKTFKGIKAEAAALAVSAAADVALVVDRAGVVEDAAFAETLAAGALTSDIVGRRLQSLVTEECADKITSAIEDAAHNGFSKWREINHPVAGAPDLAVRYMFVQLEADKRFLAFGRDLSATAAMQRRLVEAQQEMEREYARLRQAETRYRLLFQHAGEAVVILDATTLKVLEINPAALRLLDAEAPRVEGKLLPALFHTDSGERLKGMLSSLRSVGTGSLQSLQLVKPDRAVDVSVTLFNTGRSAHMLVRLAPTGSDVLVAAHNGAYSRLVHVVEAAPEGLVVTDLDGRIVVTNRSMAEFVQAASAEILVGERLSRWIGRPGAEIGALLKQVREHGVSRFFATTITGDFGSKLDVEISAVEVANGHAPCIGLVVRSIEGRLGVRTPLSGGLPESVEQLRDLVGRVPLKDLVRETTDVVERMCIEAALELTGDNRASAAEMLGLSRQSLYVKLRRYGMAADDDATG